MGTKKNGTKKTKTLNGFPWNQPPRCVACGMGVSLLYIENAVKIPGNGYLCEFCQKASGISGISAEMVACKTAVTATVFLALAGLCGKGADDFFSRYPPKDKPYADRFLLSFREISSRLICEIFSDCPCASCKDVAKSIRHAGADRQRMTLGEAVAAGFVHLQPLAGATGFHPSSRLCDCAYCRGLMK